MHPTTPIVCRVTSWYFRRMGMLAGLLLVFGLVFLYDGFRGYPATVEIAKKKEWFTSEFLPSFDVAKKEGRLEQWIAEQKARGLPTGIDGEPPRWVSYAAQNGWEEDPKLYSEREIAEQFWFGYGCTAGAFVVGVIILLNRSKVLRGEADHWVTPEGVKIAYADVFRVDKRKWEHKGLAYAWHRGVNAKAGRAVIDDLKFAGADKILERLLSRFSGELIEKVSASGPAVDAPATEVK
ncbi:MAG: hypothetical protein IAE77_25650 [Prosthecobacter sp.]|jgi:hypothetical protein|uniref:hypothetical protein n=1 Tax=Prosthecobacter sp. TaxID=1965333 RepID=UPI0019E665E3|nr:hypothetical protein [Prosthecobacter sp.]MBE2286867.1 hypothetical protein [Prosthecobacter sp.]